MLLLLVGMVVYGWSRLTGLDEFPIYFFCDEAIHPVLAKQLWNNGLRDSTGTFLPPYFQNLLQWNLSLSVYIHLVSSLLFGKSVVVTRATSVVVGMLAPVALAVALKVVFHKRSWWLAPLVMAAMPAWFLHSRTAFETAMTVGFFALFLCSYLLYRYRSPWFVVVALVSGAATFYSYSNGQGIMLVSGVLLFFTDLPYHLRTFRKHPIIFAGAVLLAVLLAVPQVRFHQLHPDELEQRLRVSVMSYWYTDLSLAEKLNMFRHNYLLALDPRYWFTYNYQNSDISRHLMKDMGHLPLVIAPFLATGLGVCLWHWRSSAHRLVLIAILAVPFSPSLVDIEIYRVLAMVVPATLLTIIGFDTLVSLIPSFQVRQVLETVSGVVLVGLTVMLLRTALTEGPTWYTSYGMDGMQYGAQQVFGKTVPELLAAAPPDTQVIVSHTWANNPIAFRSFFLTEEQQQRVHLAAIEDFTVSKGNLTPNQVFIWPVYEYRQAQASNKLIVSAPERVINYPDGTPGFYVVWMRYVDHVDELFEIDRQRRSRLEEHTYPLGDEVVIIKHSQLDMGALGHIFDGDPATVMRGAAANPFVMDFAFESPRPISGVKMRVRVGQRFSVGVAATSPERDKPYHYNEIYENLAVDPWVTLRFPDGEKEIERLRIEIKDLLARETTHVHVWELEFLTP